MEVGSVIRDARRRHALDQRALALRAGTSQTHISRIERGEISPSVATLSRLLAAMGEQLMIGAAAGPRGHQATSELREDFRRLSPGERVARAAELSSALTSVAAGRRL